MDKIEKLTGSLLAGAIGDAVGSYYEGTIPKNVNIFHDNWLITDDTQLTLATCKSIVENNVVNPEFIALEFLDWYRNNRLIGLGSATIQALEGLKIGGHWALVGKKGEYAAGNGAAMRIAPLAFILDLSDHKSKVLFKDIVRITHNNDEAYVGALAIALSIQNSMLEMSPSEILNDVIKNTPDSNTRDKLITFQSWDLNISINNASKILGNSGYVAESVSLAIYSALFHSDLEFFKFLSEIISAGGDTDTIASMACQIFGAKNGVKKIDSDLINRLPDKEFISKIIGDFIKYIYAAP